MWTHEQTHAVYNSPNRYMLPSRLCWFLCLLIFCADLAAAADFRAPESQLAEKIAAITGPGVIALDITNRSSISSADVEAIRRALISDLALAGVRVWDPDQAAAVAKLTFSENLQNYIWVAQIQQGTSDPSVVILSTPRPDFAISPQNAPPLTLHATTLISSPDPILDAALLEGNPRRVLALGTNAVTVYDFKDNRWVPDQSLPISHPNPLPRDPRGRIILQGDHLFDAYLPGLVCHSNNAAPITISCQASDDPWPLQTHDFGVSAFFAPTRNFFTGALAPGIGKQNSAPPFYSAASIPRDKYALWIFAGVDGQLHLLDGINQQAGGKIHWGSDIAGIHADCRPGWQVLASSASDEDSDSLQAFEFPDREPVAATQKLALTGRISALWTAQKGDNVIAVYRDTASGNYEAIQLTLTCNQ
jgi:hypothetical protein